MAENENFHDTNGAPKARRELSKDEMDLLHDETIPVDEEGEIPQDDEFALYRELDDEEKKWAKIQMQLDWEQYRLFMYYNDM